MINTQLILLALVSISLVLLSVGIKTKKITVFGRYNDDEHSKEREDVEYYLLFTGLLVLIAIIIVYLNPRHTGKALAGIKKRKKGLARAWTAYSDPTYES